MTFPPGARAPAVAGLLAVLGFGFIAPAFLRPLRNPDEPRVASIGWAMSRPGGDLVVPRLNGEPFIQEPPLCQWLVAFSFRATGAEPGDDWAPRIPSMAFAVVTVLLVFRGASRQFGTGAGLIAALLLASTAEYLEVANRAGPDAALTFFVTVAGLELLEIAREPGVSLRRAAVLGAATGLAFLSKNLLGPAYLLLVLAALLVSRRDLFRAPGALSGAGLAVAAFAVVSFPWLVLLFWRDPSLVEHLLVSNTLGRFTSAGRHDPGLFEFAGRLLADMLPWTPILAPALWALGRRALKGPSRDPRSLVLLSWAALPTLLVFASGSKRDLYLLPIIPALAICGAGWLDGVIERPAARRLSLGVIAVSTALLLGTGIFGGIWAESLPAGFYSLLAVYLFVLYRWGRALGWREPASSGLTAVLLLSLLMVGGNLVRCGIPDPRRSYLPLAAELRELRKEGFRVEGYRLGLREVSAVTYYLAGPVTNHLDAQAAEAALSPAGPPAALVVENAILEDETLPAIRDAPRRRSFEVSRGLWVLTNRP